MREHIRKFELLIFPPSLSLSKILPTSKDDISCTEPVILHFYLLIKYKYVYFFKRKKNAKNVHKMLPRKMRYFICDCF